MMANTSALARYRKDPYLTLKLTGLLAGGLVLAVGGAALPDKPKAELSAFDVALKTLAAAGTKLSRI